MFLELVVGRWGVEGAVWVYCHLVAVSEVAVAGHCKARPPPSQKGDLSTCFFLKPNRQRMFTLFTWSYVW